VVDIAPSQMLSASGIIKFVTKVSKLAAKPYVKSKRNNR